MNRLDDTGEALARVSMALLLLVAVATLLEAFRP
jgi:hypothetical protein